jgi:hypothetical protein
VLRFISLWAPGYWQLPLIREHVETKALLGNQQACRLVRAERERATGWRMRELILSMTEDGSGYDIAGRHDVAGYPHLVALDKSGLVACRHRGYADESSIEEWRCPRIKAIGSWMHACTDPSQGS